jgi:hypothetical protein
MVSPTRRGWFNQGGATETPEQGNAKGGEESCSLLSFPDSAVR